MTHAVARPVLNEAFWPAEGAALWIKRLALVLGGVGLHVLAAKVAVPVWPSPVPVTLGSLAVLGIAAAYGPRLGLATIGLYMVLGALGWDVFAGTSAEMNGLAYMTGGTGGYLAGWVIATVILGQAARRGLDRSVGGMALAMLAGTVAIYVPGVLWLGVLYGWDQPLIAWGVTPFLVGDALKLGLASLLVPGLWRIVGRARG